MPLQSSFSSNLRRRVGTLPCKSTTFRSGRFQRSWCCRRTLPVAIVAPCGKLVRLRSFFVIKTSPVWPRGKAAQISRSSIRSLGKSFALCTARSIRLTRSCFSISRVNIPLRPALRSATASVRTLSSPLVRMISVVTSNSGQAARNACSTSRACARARSLPRDPRTIVPGTPTQLSEARREGSLNPAGFNIRSRAETNQPLKSCTCPAIISSLAAICCRRSASDCCAIDCSESMS